MSTDIALLIATGEDQTLEPEGDIFPILNRMRGRAIFMAFQFNPGNDANVSTSSQKGTLPLEPCKAILLYAVDQVEKLNTTWKLLQAPDFQGALRGEFPHWQNYQSQIPIAASKLNNPAMTLLWVLQKLLTGGKNPGNAILEAANTLKAPSIGALHNRGSSDLYLWDTMDGMRFVEYERIRVFFSFPLPGVAENAEYIKQNSVLLIDLVSGDVQVEGSIDIEGFVQPGEEDPFTDLDDEEAGVPLDKDINGKD